MPGGRARTRLGVKVVHVLCKLLQTPVLLKVCICRAIEPTPMDNSDGGARKRDSEREADREVKQACMQDRQD